jgi:hypothetical protein
MSDPKPLGITEVVLRDGHQSLLATRMRIDDMLPIARNSTRSASGRLKPGAARLSTRVFATWVKTRGSASGF